MTGVARLVFVLSVIKLVKTALGGGRFGATGAVVDVLYCIQCMFWMTISGRSDYSMDLYQMMDGMNADAVNVVDVILR